MQNYQPMNPTREEALFGLALTKPAADRAAWLDRECGDDKALRARLEALLAAHEQPETVLATKVVARFEAERQALAMMDHPNIAKVLDAGTTDVGRPYFVMELVPGIRITDYCDQANLTTKERLDLFIKVCQAIQHAHQKGIIHRDIKPSNILVTLHDGVPVPKVIDFGIAKATEGRLTDNTVYTQLHQFIGTPAYMSPEQAEMSGLDIDTRSDIYSLGVLLYELLAGSTPFDAKELMASGIDAMRKTIRENEPVRPSTKLSQTLVGADVRRLKSPASDKPSSEEEIRASSRRLLRIGNHHAAQGRPRQDRDEVRGHFGAFWGQVSPFNI